MNVEEIITRIYVGTDDFCKRELGIILLPVSGTGVIRE